MSLLTPLLRLFHRKSVSTGSIDSAPPLDVYRRHRAPSPHELLHELKGTAWTCASINSAVCASFPPRLYIATAPEQPAPRCQTRSLDLTSQRRLLQLRSFTAPNATIEEVVHHPLLTLLRQVNPCHNAFDLWELSELYLEVHGSAYWLLDFDPLQRLPARIWILPAQLVTPHRDPGSPHLVDYFEYAGRTLEKIPADRVIHFRFPHPRDPYTAGLSPLRACFEQVALTSEYAAMKRAIYDNTGLPSVLVTPEEPIGAGERNRLETQWRQKFTRGGQGQALVTESGFKVTLLSQSMGDLAALADMKATKEDIANAFHVPLPLLTGDTNLANMQAADHLHKALAIAPRLRRRDEKLNEQLLPLFDPTGRLFLASDDCIPANQQFLLQQEQADLKAGVRTINEVRSARGLAPVAWGERPQSPTV